MNMIKIEVLSGPMDGLEFVFQKDDVSIGRENDRDVSLPLDSLVSRLHAKLTCKDGSLWIEDMGSTNGTYIADQRIEKREVLPRGTIFTVGMSELRIEDVAEVSKGNV